MESTLPVLLLFTGIWAYHWLSVRRQKIQVQVPAGSIDWPRRPAIATLSLIGLGMAAFALADLLKFLAGALASHHTGNTWWQASVGSHIGLIVVGIAMWLPAWTILQRAAAASSETERNAWARKSLLTIVSIGSGVFMAGVSLVLILFQVFARFLLVGVPSSTPSLTELVAVGILGSIILAYHGSILLAERGSRRAAQRPLALSVLVGPNAAGTLDELSHDPGICLTVTGYIGDEPIHAEIATRDLQARLRVLAAGGTERALVVLSSAGATIYEYSPTPIATSSSGEETKAEAPASAAEGVGAGL